MHPPRRPKFRAVCDDLASHPRSLRCLCAQLHRLLSLARPSIFLWLISSFLLPGVLLPDFLVSAQGPADGALYGVLRDPSARPLEHATVTLQNSETLEDRTIVVDGDGSFLLPHLAPGSYLLLVSVFGIPQAHFGPLTISLGQTLEFREALGAESAADPLAKPSEETLSDRAFPAGAFDRVAVLPVGGAPWLALAATAAGTVPDENADGLQSADGLSPTQNNVTIDSASATQSYGSVPLGTGSDPALDADDDSDSADLTTGSTHGLARGRHAGASYSFSQAALRSFRAAGQGSLLASYSAQVGHAAGASFTSVSRSGTSTFHGSGFLVLRTSALAAKNALSVATTYAQGVVRSEVVKPHDLRENFGGTLGGRIPRVHDGFFFYTYDQQRRGFPAISSPADPNFYNLTPTQLALLANRGVTSAATNAALTYVASLTGETPRRADQTIHFGKLEWKPRPRLELGLQENRVRWSSPAGLIDAPVVARGRASLGTSAGSLDSVLLRATSIFSTHTLNQIRLSYGRDLQYERAQPKLPQEPGVGPAGMAPEVNIGPNGLLFGTPATVARSAYPDERRIELADTFTLARGHHLIQLGGDVAFVHDRVATLSNEAGTFRYDSANVRGFAGGLVDFITDYTFNVNTSPNGGCPSINAAIHLFCFRSFSQSFGQNSVAFSTQEWAGFLEDTWRPRTGLTLLAGLRYEYMLLPLPQKPNPALDAFFGGRAASSVFPEDRNNLGPRVALAYQPFGPSGGTLSLGYGFFFGRLPGATIRSALSDTAQPSATTRLRFTPAAVVDCPQVPFQGFGYPCSFLAQPSGSIGVPSSAVAFDRHFRLPVVQQASLSLERQVTRRASMSVRYVLNLDRQLPSSTDLNIAPSSKMQLFQLHGGTGAPGVRSGELFTLPLYTARIDPNFGPVTEIVSHTNATYQAIIVDVNARPLRALQFRSKYTWSKAIDFGQNSSAIPRTDAQFDPFTNGYDKGLSSLNYPSVFHLSVTGSAGAERGPSRLRNLGRAWEMACILAARSGRPYSFDLFGGTRLPGGHASINGSGGALYLPTVGRNTLRLPPTVNVDLRVGREFERSQRIRMRISAEAFNVANHRNISSVNQRAYLVGTEVGGIVPLVFQDAATIALEGLNTQPFGTTNATSTSIVRERQIQLSLHLSF